MRIFWLIISLIFTCSIFAQDFTQPPIPDHRLRPSNYSSAGYSHHYHPAYWQESSKPLQSESRQFPSPDVNDRMGYDPCKFCVGDDISKSIPPTWVHSFERWDTEGEAGAGGHTVLKDGSIVTTGSCIRMGHYVDFLTVCVDREGNERWRDFYDGQAGGDDMGYGVVRGDSGEVYVYGISLGTSGLFEMVLIRYNIDGNREWIYRDHGHSAGSNGYWNLRQWVFVKNGLIRFLIPAGNDVRVVFIWESGEQISEHVIHDELGFPIALVNAALDIEHNLVLACLKKQTVTDHSITDDALWANDIIIQKIDTLGSLIWSYEENAPPHDEMELSDMVVDSSGNIYFSGVHYPCCETEDRGFVFLTKVNPLGELVWQRTALEDSIHSSYFSRLCLTTDNQLILLTETPWYGWIDDGAYLITYTKQGVELGRMFLEIETGYQPSILIDKEYIWIYEPQTIKKYRRTGELIWEGPDAIPNYSGYHNAQFTLLQSGQFMISGSVSEGQGTSWRPHYFAGRFDSDGKNLWHFIQQSDQTVMSGAYDVIASDDGYLYVTGYDNGKYVTQKIDVSGNVIWTLEEIAGQDLYWYWRDHRIEMDEENNVYVLLDDRYLCKYSRHGQRMWKKDVRQGLKNLTPGLNMSSAHFMHIKGLPEGHITLYGFWGRYEIIGNDNFYNRDTFIISLNLDGEIKWSKNIDKGLSIENGEYYTHYDYYWDYPYDMSVGPDGSVFIAIKHVNGLKPVQLKYYHFDSEGNPVWEKNLVDLGMEEPSAICVNDQNESILTGIDEWDSEYNTIMNVKFDHNGKIMWKRSVPLPGWGRPSQIKFSDSGQIYMSGYYDWVIPNSGGRRKCSGVLYQFNSHGVRQWEKTIPDLCYGTLRISNGSVENVYIGGRSGNSAVVGFNDHGKQLFQIGYSDPQAGEVRFNGYSVDPYGGVTVAASVRGYGGSYWSKFRVLHYDVNSIDGVSPEPLLTLRQNHPNPFSRSTIIRINLSERSDVKLTVYNSLGQEVQRNEVSEQAAGEYEYTLHAKGLANGVYLYRVEAGEEVKTRKMVLVR